jgi:hypothetical protein
MVTPDTVQQTQKVNYTWSAVGMLSFFINMYLAGFSLKLYAAFYNAYHSDFGLFLRLYAIFIVLLYTWFSIRYFRAIKGTEQERLKAYMLSHWSRWLGSTIFAGFTAAFFNMSALYILFLLLLLAELGLVFLLVRNKGLNTELLHSPAYLHINGFINFAVNSFMPYMFQHYFAALLILFNVKI